MTSLYVGVDCLVEWLTGDSTDSMTWSCNDSVSGTLGRHMLLWLSFQGSYFALSSILEAWFIVYLFNMRIPVPVFILTLADCYRQFLYPLPQSTTSSISHLSGMPCPTPTVISSGLTSASIGRTCAWHSRPSVSLQEYSRELMGEKMIWIWVVFNGT